MTQTPQAHIPAREQARAQLTVPAQHPMVTVLDGHPHTLAFLAGVHQVKSRNLGVDAFGQAGAVDDVYRYHGIDTDSMVRAVLDLVQ